MVNNVPVTFSQWTHAMQVTSAWFEGSLHLLLVEQRGAKLKFFHNNISTVMSHGAPETNRSLDQQVSNLVD